MAGPVAGRSTEERPTAAAPGLAPPVAHAQSTEIHPTTGAGRAARSDRPTNQRAEAPSRADLLSAGDYRVTLAVPALCVPLGEQELPRRMLTLAVAEVHDHF